MIQEKYGNAELSSWEPVRVTVPSFLVSDDEVLAEMERIASRHGANEAIDSHPIKADDLVCFKIITREGAKVFPGFTHDDVDVQLGVGSLPNELETALLGHVPGDTVEVDFIYEDNSQVATRKETPSDGGCGVADTGEPMEIPLHSVVEIRSIKRHVIPDITDEWVKEKIALSDSVEDFRDRTARKLFLERQRRYANEIEHEVMRVLGERLVGEPDSAAITGVEKQMLREFDRFLDQFELDRPAYLAIQGMDDATFFEQIARDARERVRQDVALAAWATHFGISLTDEDIDFMFGEPTPEKTYAARVEAEQSGQIDAFKDLALRAKVAENLTRSAVFVGEDGAVDHEFKRAVDEKYRKLQMVRRHATAAPMTTPPMINASESRRP
ncbi:hypothetical protein VJ923_09790 [Adlercreutzia sp. R25]|uniref:Trigger factor C-terminal domain-containing protein n=1 Tax=Adlercreutzia shanghongiae TaxID=3111773 RepID=A0ABU6J0Y4_9ACTN|nr:MULTISPECIES: hypothetical protein [unclassified Adlercreutzia]MEC4273447.1 hypothetical protein [Adlercreutzia sp. R25]MEC4295709.1 hypothetical protein [Adlercreutzia sp. R22]